MNNESWYTAKLSDMDVVRICDSDDFVVDYDKSRGMYRVSFFGDGHFKDECWFRAYQTEKEVDDRIEKIIDRLEELKVNFKEGLTKRRKALDGNGMWYFLDRLIIEIKNLK